MPRLVSNQRYAATSDFRISDSGADNQTSPVFATLAGGNFVAIWSHGIGIRAQIFDRNGREVGDEFAIGQGTAGYQPTVSALPTGGFVVGWSVDISTDINVYAQIFNAAGGTVGASFMVNTNVSGFQVDPKVATLAGGGFVMTWLQPNDGTFDNVHAQVFDANGAKVGTEFLAGDSRPGTKDDHDVIALAGGGFVVAWTQPNADDSRTGTRAQVFDAAGNKVGDAFTLNTITVGYQGGPDLAALPSGGFVAAWSDDGDTFSGPDNGNRGIWAQRFDANGVKVGDDIHVSTQGPYGQGSASVKIIPGVGFLVVWTDGNETATDFAGHLRGQMFDFDGNKTGEEFSIDPGVQAGHSIPEIAVLDTGAFVVGWEHRAGPQFNDTDVRARIFFPTTFGTNNAETLNGTVNRDFLYGLDGDDRLSGGAEDDGLVGGNGADFLDGGTGRDEMEGGAGNDTYIVDNAGDIVTELAGEGFDAAYCFASFALGNNSELEWLSTIDNNGTTAINLTGSLIGQYLIGNQGANVLNGLAGADFMQGFGGNDTYFVDNGADAPVEVAGQGFDSVYTEISFGLANGTEIEWLSAVSTTATTAINLLGNEFAQYLVGNNGANALDGAGGADTMIGYGGNDTYIVDQAGDSVVEAVGGGFDAVYTTSSFALGAGSEVEWISAASVNAATAINLTGNEFVNYLLGNNGANTINGGAGSDFLYGYLGADTFAFTTALGASNVDTIMDFSSVTDRIALDDAIFTAIGAPGALAAGAFVVGMVAGDADDRIIYNSATGQLYYDADGNGAGAAVLFAALSGNPALAASDFQVI